MCGITGILDPHGDSSLPDTIESMRQRLTHRGPDDHGTWLQPEAGVALGHCRLSILDLSRAGHQPMVSADGRYVLSYNGELYNHVDLRRELDNRRAAPRWQGHSDTETLLAVLAHWGIEDGLRRLNGMFAFALWDRRRSTLYLARDRIGEKPLYYGSIGTNFVFASQLNALRAHRGWEGRIDPSALALFLRFGYVPSPWSIYSGISKLEPAHYLEVRHGGRSVGAPTRYWSLADVARIEPSREATPDAVVDELHDLLFDAVGRRMQADVPVGAFLSGGIDSSTVTALMQAQSAKPVNTFTIGFRESGFDEAGHAREVAEHLGTNHTELYLSAADALSTVPMLAQTWDEPFADPSQIPTLLVSQLARERVKVVLSGDGGDELFLGYSRYARTRRFWSVLKRTHPRLRRYAAHLLSNVPLHPVDSLMARSRLPGIRPLGQRLGKLAALLSEETRSGLYEQEISHWANPGDVVTGHPDHLALIGEIDEPWLHGVDEAMRWVDTHLYLPDDVLVKLDRASMSVSLEARVPLLDHRVIEFAWGLPPDYLKMNRMTKWPLRHVLHRYIPRKLVDRPKMGFGVPLEEWLRGPLREWGEDLLMEDRLREQGFFNADLIRQTWNDHLTGRGRHHFQLWDVLMFQAWLETVQNPLTADGST